MLITCRICVKVIHNLIGYVTYFIQNIENWTNKINKNKSKVFNVTLNRAFSLKMLELSAAKTTQTSLYFVFLLEVFLFCVGG